MTQTTPVILAWGAMIAEINRLARAKKPSPSCLSSCKRGCLTDGAREAGTGDGASWSGADAAPCNFFEAEGASCCGADGGCGAGNRLWPYPPSASFTPHLVFLEQVIIYACSLQPLCQPQRCAVLRGVPQARATVVDFAKAKRGAKPNIVHPCCMA